MGKFHTSNGRFVGWSRLPNGFASLAQAALRRTTGRIPRAPWIPFAARRALERVMQPAWIVWEIGAGFSTLWLADRVQKLTSIESSREWFERLQSLAAAAGKTNVDLRFEWVADAIADFSSVTDESLDLLFIDGGPRENCLRNGFAKVRPGGFVYLDNWDNASFWPTAKAFLREQAGQVARQESLIDYVPGQLGVYEGLLLQKKGHPPPLR